MSSKSMPAAFIGHGSPMNTLEKNRFTKSWRAFGQSLPKPRAILVISAHWYVRGTAVTAMPRPRVIHDFSGFPPPLSTFKYPAAGSPQLAAEVAEIVKPTTATLDTRWGLDHGTWSVLAHMFPKADVPVVQLSIDAGMTFQQHIDLGAKLAPLRNQGVLILGSGNVVHNLRKIGWTMEHEGFDWAQRFDTAARTLMTDAPGDIAKLREHRDFGNAVPTPDHFIPLLHIAGIAASTGTTPGIIVDGCTMGSLSMTSYRVAV